MLGTPVDLSKLTVEHLLWWPGIADHISPWQSCYRSARLLGAKDLRFVLSTSGHIAALGETHREIPGPPTGSARPTPPDPAAWLQGEPEQQGLVVAELRGLARPRRSGAAKRRAEARSAAPSCLR